MVRTVAANDDDGDYIDDEIEEAEKRELKIESENGSVTVESKSENKTVENEFEIKFSTEEGIRLDLGFSSETNATEFELEVKVLFYQLVEFVDQNGDGVPSAGEEVQTMDLTAKAYSSSTVTQITSKDGESGYKFESHIMNEAFVFQIIAEIFPTYALVNDTIVKPMEMKITIVIKDFPYEESGALALMIKATSEMEIEREYGDVEEEIEVKSATAEGYFSWSKEVWVDSVSKEVKSSVVNTEKGKLIALSYPNGKDIVHDPKLGVSLVSSVAGLPWIYMVVGAAIIALAVAIGIKVFRPKMLDLASLRVYLTKGEP
jgi:hypothetical protein